jgi:hypothetical protein
MLRPFSSAPKKKRRQDAGATKKAQDFVEFSG